MSRLLLSAAFLLSAAAVMADDAKKDDKKEEKAPVTFAEKLKAIRADYTKVAQEASKGLKDAKTDDEKAPLYDKMMAAQKAMAKKSFELAKTEPANAQSLQLAVGAFGLDAATAKEAGDFLLEHYAESDKLLTAIPALSGSPAGTEFLDRLVAKTTKKELKAAIQLAAVTGDVEKTDYPRGGPAVPPEQAKAKYDAAKVKLDALAKEFGDLPAGTRTRPGQKADTVADAAKKVSFFIDNLTLGKTAPEIECETLDGGKKKLSDYRGKVVVVDVWATWCGPCRAMIPHERELVERMKDKPFELISVSADAKKETLTEFLEKEKMPWTHFWNGGASGNMLDTYQIRFYPTIYVLDQKGVIRFKHVRGKAMDEAVEKLLAEGGNKSGQ